MTKNKILLFYSELEKTNIIYFLNNIDYKQYDVDLILEENINKKKEIPKKVNIIKYNNNRLKKILFKIQFKFKYKNKYDTSIVYSSDNLFSNSLIRLASKNRIIFINNNKLTEFNYREYFIKRHIYDFNKIIFKTHQEEKQFLKYYPTLSKKTHVINSFINYEEIEKLSKETINEKIRKTDKTLLLITELNEEKNKLLNIMNIIKEIKNEIKNIKLYIIGDGIDKYAYESFIEDNKLEDTIHLLGNKENTYPYIEKCKYILLKSKEELDKYLIPCQVLKTQVITDCRYSDDNITLGEDFGYLISKNKNKQQEDILTILTTKSSKKSNYIKKGLNESKINSIMNK